MKKPFDILNELDSIRAETLKRLAPLSQAQLDWRPSFDDGEDAWSLGEIFIVSTDAHQRLAVDDQVVLLLAGSGVSVIETP